MNAKDFDIPQLSNAILWWLNYINAVRRGYVLSESAIKFPVSEYLIGSEIRDKELEFSHPKLFKKRFDLFVAKNSKEKMAFEFKYIKYGSTRTSDEKQRIFNDLMRLFLFHGNQEKGYFLICGNQVGFKSDFQRILKNPVTTNNKFMEELKFEEKKILEKTQPEGFYTEWFGFEKDEEKKIDLNTNKPEYKRIYDKFFDEYSEPYKKKTLGDLPRPDWIKTKLVFLSSEIKQSGVLQPSKIGIWEVLPVE